MSESPFNDAVIQAANALEKLAEELSQTSEALWDNSAFHNRFDRHMASMARLLTSVESLTRNNLQVEVTVWDHILKELPPPPREPWWKRLGHVVAAIMGRSRPEPDLPPSVQKVSRKARMTVPDPRKPGGGEVTVSGTVQVERAGRLKSPALAESKWGSARWLTQWMRKWPRAEEWAVGVKASLLRLFGKPVPGLQQEMQTVPMEVPVTLPAIEIDQLSILARAYWIRQGQLETDVLALREEMQFWDQKTADQAQRADALRREADRLAQSVRELTRPAEGRKQLEVIEQRIHAAREDIENRETASRSLANELQQLVANLDADRKERLDEI